MTAFAIVRIPSFSIAALRRAEPALAEQPLLLVANRGGQTIVVAASEPVVSPGLSLRWAQLLCPEAIIRPHEPMRDQAVLLELRTALDAVSPKVALLTTQPDAAFAVDLGRLGTKELRVITLLLAQRISERIQLVPVIGAGASKTIAHLAARLAQPKAPLIVPSGGEAAWLAPHPIDVLPIDQALVTRLHQFGLRTVGVVARLPCDALEAQFGRAGRELFDLTHGRDPLPLGAPPPLQPLVVGRRFAGLVADRLVLEAALSQVAARLASRLLRRGQAARRLTLTLTPEHGLPLETERMLAEPTADPARLQAVLCALLRDLDLQEACEELSVTLEPTTLSVAQRELFAPETASAERLQATLRRLALKHGEQLLQATLAEPGARCLERRVRLEMREEW
jgi:nucleotidyltransferase/DNA polymerase involved in DNA repair